MVDEQRGQNKVRSGKEIRGLVAVEAYMSLSVAPSQHIA